jgi:hypothetical protein
MKEQIQMPLVVIVSPLVPSPLGEEEDRMPVPFSSATSLPALSFHRTPPLKGREQKTILQKIASFIQDLTI